ncbi:MAG: T9SS type A sorting domain-containing protein [Ignavibacteria bacterium]|nr:T9SS type A sorting domain-containing protein [Ignavibacteria bacterium]
MSNLKTFFIFLFSVLVFLNTNTSKATTINITSSNFVFTPANVSAVVGDTIKWTNLNGSHTTTCNGQQGTARPNGAAPWDAPLDNNNLTFSYVITVPGNYQYVCTPHSPDMSGIIIATLSSISQLNEIAIGYELSQNYPNPFNPETAINFTISLSSDVKLDIYNIAGQNVASLVNQKLTPGAYKVRWNASNITSGVYFYTLRTENFSETKKMFLIK